MYDATFMLYSDTELLARFAKEANDDAARGDYAGALVPLRGALERYGDLFGLGLRLKDAIREMEEKVAK